MIESLNILVVDDEEAILRVFRDYLASTTNHKVYTAGSGLEALEILQREKVHCCFTDIAMPHMDGMELTRRIHSLDNTIPVVVMTGYPSMEKAIKTLKNGVVDFLTKPFKMEEVPPILAKIMVERSQFIENILLKEKTRKNRELVKVDHELKQKTGEIETINFILQQLNQAFTSQDLFHTMVNLSGSITSCDEAHFCVLSPHTNDFMVITSFYRDGKKHHASSPAIDRKIVQKVARDGIPFLVKSSSGTGSIMAVPLKVRSSVFGVLFSHCRNKNCRFSEKDLYFLNFLAEKASFSVENLALYENIYGNLFSTLYAFVGTIEARDPYTRQHSSRVTGYAMSIAKAMSCSAEELEVLHVSGNLHDIGKIGVPDCILLKPGRLTQEEYEVIKKHPLIGSHIIGHFNMWTQEQDVIKYHHERWDGKGYPDRLRGEEIPALSRILAVADVYDALASDRSYRKRLPEDVVVRLIRENSGTQFDPQVVNVFLELHAGGLIGS